MPLYHHFFLSLCWECWNSKETVWEESFDQFRIPDGWRKEKKRLDSFDNLPFRACWAALGPVCVFWFFQEEFVSSCSQYLSIKRARRKGQFIEFLWAAGGRVGCRGRLGLLAPGRGGASTVPHHPLLANSSSDCWLHQFKLLPDKNKFC